MLDLARQIQCLLSAMSFGRIFFKKLKSSHFNDNVFCCTAYINQCCWLRVSKQIEALMWLFRSGKLKFHFDRISCFKTTSFFLHQRIRWMNRLTCLSLFFRIVISWSLSIIVSFNYVIKRGSCGLCVVPFDSVYPKEERSNRDETRIAVCVCAQGRSTNRGAQKDPVGESSRRCTWLGYAATGMHS